MGGHGLQANLSKRGLTTTASLPGSGLSYRHTWGSGKRLYPDQVRAEALKINQDFTDRMALYTQNPGDVEALRQLIAAAGNLGQFSCAYVGGAGAAGMRAALDGFKRQLVELEAGGERAAVAEEMARHWVEDRNTTRA